MAHQASNNWDNPYTGGNFQLVHSGFAWCTTPIFRIYPTDAWVAGLRPDTITVHGTSAVSTTLAINVYDATGTLLNTVDTGSIIFIGAFSRSIALGFSENDIGYIEIKPTVDDGSIALTSIALSIVLPARWTNFIGSSEER